MVNNIFQLLFLVLGIFLVGNGFSWSMINYVTKKRSHFNLIKKAKIILTYWLNFSIVSLLFLVPLGVISYFILINLIFDPSLFKSSLSSLQIVFLVAFYFMITGFCLLNLPLKKLLKNIFVIGFKDIHWILLSLLSILSLFFLSLLLIYYGTNSLWLMILGGVLSVVILIFGKFFLVSVVKRL